MIRIVLCFCLSFLTVLVVPAAANSTFLSIPKVVQGNPATHKVVAKETLFSISRQYGVSVADLAKLNPEAKNGLKIGQVLRIPAKTESFETPAEAVKPVAPVKTKATETAKPTPAPEASAVISAENGQKIHKVMPKQNLYTIAIQNGVTMAQIRKWNNLKSDALKPGQLLIVSEAAKEISPVKAETPVASEAPKTVITKAEVKVKGDKTKTETKTETVKEEPKEVISENDDKADLKTIESAGKITETGLAEVIPQTNDSNKYLALHKTAPIGTILQIKNIMNGQDVYVRVIGKLPDTGANDKVIVRISKKAYQRLAAIDNRFRVEVSYMP